MSIYETDLSRSAEFVLEYMSLIRADLPPESIYALKKFILDEITKIVEMTTCGVRHNVLYPRVNPQDDYCLEIFHHLMGIQFTEIKQRLEVLFTGNPGTGGVCP